MINKPIQIQIGPNVERLVEIAHADAHRDFVILKIPGFDLPCIPLGNSNEVHVTDEAVALGYPKGIDCPYSPGKITTRTQHPDKTDYEIFLTSTDIDEGSSGGPLLNSNAEVIGIMTAFEKSPRGTNLALPINLVRAVLPEDVVCPNPPPTPPGDDQIDDDQIAVVEAEDCGRSPNCRIEGSWKDWGMPEFSNYMLINNEGADFSQLILDNIQGTRMSVVFRQDTWYGTLKIEVDGNVIKELSQRGPIINQAEFPFDLEGPGPHTVVFTGTRQTGVVTIDAVKIEP